LTFPRALCRTIGDQLFVIGHKSKQQLALFVVKYSLCDLAKLGGPFLNRNGVFFVRQNSYLSRAAAKPKPMPGWRDVQK
jgi:hypothetical protein